MAMMLLMMLISAKKKMKDASDGDAGDQDVCVVEGFGADGGGGRYNYDSGCGNIGCSADDDGDGFLLTSRR